MKASNNKGFRGVAPKKYPIKARFYTFFGKKVLRYLHREQKPLEMFELKMLLIMPLCMALTLVAKGQPTADEPVDQPAVENGVADIALQDGAVMKGTAGERDVSYTIDGLPVRRAHNLESELEFLRHELLQSIGGGRNDHAHFRSEQPQYLYPGDVNGDGVANVKDLLYTAVAYGKQGPARVGGSDAWDAQLAPGWGQTFPNGLDYSFADANGDGVVDKADVQVISDNYGLTHQKSDQPGAKRQAFSQLLPRVNEDILAAGAFTAIEIDFVNQTTPPDSIYGLAFSMNMDADLIEPGSIVLMRDSSALGKPAELLHIDKVFHNDGRIDIGLSRADGKALEVNDVVIKVGIITIDNLSGREPEGSAILHIELLDAVVINERGEEVVVEVGETEVVLLDPSTGIEDAAPTNDHFQLYPNPGIRYVDLQISEVEVGIEIIEVLDMSGRIIMEEILRTAGNGGETRKRLDVSDLQTGMYMVRVRGDDFIATKKLMIQ